MPVKAHTCRDGEGDSYLDLSPWSQTWKRETAMPRQSHLLTEGLPSPVRVVPESQHAQR